MPSKPAPPFAPLDPPEKSRALLLKQLDELQVLKQRQFNEELKAAEKQWQHVTNVIIERAFEPNSTNQFKFHNALHAGQGRIQRQPYGQPSFGPSIQQQQSVFNSRCAAMETLLKSIIQELELSIPDAEIKGAYAPGEDYEFYRDLKGIVEKGERSLFIIDNYLDAQLFDLYVERVRVGVDIRVLTDQLRGAVQVIAGKFAKRGQFELRTSRDTHDRHVFADDRGWVIGQSIKDAAVKKPTYIIELGNPSALKAMYEIIWSTAISIVRT